MLTRKSEIMAGNTRAQKGDKPASAQIQFRIQPDLKAKIKAAADGHSMTISQFVIKAVEKELK